MIKVLIIEDEPPISRSLEKLIRQIDGDFEIVAMAENGKTGIKLYEDFKPDVVFTDIKMPVMDGFDFLDYLRKEDNKTKVVILTGYPEFEYAKKAIMYQTFDYLLKPISKNVLSGLLKNIKDLFNKEKSEEKSALIAQYFIKSNIQQKEIRAGRCTIAVMCAGSIPLSSDEGMFPGSSVWNHMDRYRRYLNDFLQVNGMDDKAVFWDFSGFTTCEHVFIVEADLDSVEILSELYDKIREDNSVPITMVTHREKVDYSSIGAMHMKLRRKLYEGLLFGRSRILLLEDGESPDPQADDFQLSESLKNIRYQCGTKDKLKVRAALEEFFKECRKTVITQKSLLKYIENITYDYCNYFYNRQVINYEIELPAIISNHYDFLTLGHEMLEVLEHAIKEEKQEESHPVLYKVKKYIENNYRNQISNETLAEEFGFVSSYLCRIYKNEYGISPGKYLVKLRIEEAKNLMQANPGMLIKEVGAFVGYTDPYYFSKVFYKETGIWPTQFSESQV